MQDIAISGKAGSGKTTMAALVETALAEYGCPVQRIAYGDGLKQEIKEQYSLVKGDPGWRERAHSHGAYRRQENHRYWIDHLNTRVEAIHQAGAVVIVDDLRLEPEYDDFVRQDFLLVRVNAPAALRAQRLAANGGEPEVAYSTLINECALDDHHFDVVIDNHEQCSHEDLVVLAAALVDEQLH